MNIAYIWFKCLSLYLKTPFIKAIFLLGVLNYIFWQKLAGCFSSVFVNFLLADLCYSFCLYILMIITGLVTYYGKFKQANIFVHLKRSVFKSLPILIIKLSWNLAYVSIMGFDYLPDENLGLFPSFLLFFIWALIFLFGATFIPRNIIDIKNTSKYDLISTINYIKFSVWYLIASLMWCLITACGFLMVVAFIFSYLSKTFIFMVSPLTIKTIFEDFLYASIFIFFAQLLSISVLFIYIRQSSNYRRGFNLKEL